MPIPLHSVRYPSINERWRDLRSSLTLLIILLLNIIPKQIREVISQSHSRQVSMSISNLEKLIKRNAQLHLVNNPSPGPIIPNEALWARDVVPSRIRVGVPVWLQGSHVDDEATILPRCDRDLAPDVCEHLSFDRPQWSKCSLEEDRIDLVPISNQHQCINGREKADFWLEIDKEPILPKLPAVLLPKKLAELFERPKVDRLKPMSLCPCVMREDDFRKWRDMMIMFVRLHRFEGNVNHEIVREEWWKLEEKMTVSLKDHVEGRSGDIVVQVFAHCNYRGPLALLVQNTGEYGPDVGREDGIICATTVFQRSFLKRAGRSTALGTHCHSPGYCSSGHERLEHVLVASLDDVANLVDHLAIVLSELFVEFLRVAGNLFDKTRDEAKGKGCLPVLLDIRLWMQRAIRVSLHVCTILLRPYLKATISGHDQVSM